ncbi:sodium:solute symporter family protein [uncultured Cobetia sp.]|jgi:Na+/proline symporter|uniref:sodium:solute symporter family protein n=1 Tax=uncultured Cobetia sp. TaxID=410706 RepID=UPI0030EC2747|tara:strand:- start:496 stop:2016 length:1521 start_codon:yes stop_codon:yes gene_type:complete
MNNTITIAVLVAFISVFILISLFAKRSANNTQSTTSEDFVIGGRGMGTLVLVLSMGATYFSTWTLLGAFGSYYREGIWFVGFAVWTIFHGIFIWMFGTRIWLAGKRFGFITPGQMIERYYRSKRLKIAVAVIGITALVPVMLIQIVGGAKALDALSGGAIPYVVGVTVTSIMVGVIVLWAGFKGTAWTDSFMGIFFASVLIFTAIYVVNLAGGSQMFAAVAEIQPELLVNSGKPLKMLELWLGLGFGAWVLPHMWQKFYSASSAEVLGKVAMATPFWNSWMMAIIPLLVGLAAVIPGVAPGLDSSSSDTILPLIFNEHLPLLGAFVVAGILAAAISTINSQLLSSASIVAEDIVNSFSRMPLSSQRITLITRVVVASLTVLVFLLAMLPSGAGYLVPIASLGFGLGLQLVPSALGMLHFRRITEAGAFAGLLSGTAVMAILAILQLDIIIGPSISGFIVNLVVMMVVSRLSAPVCERSLHEFHDMFDEYMCDNCDMHVPSSTQPSR